eukprot:1153857-Pelagomonas_calceolata.AAC.2
MLLFSITPLHPFSPSYLLQTSLIQNAIRLRLCTYIEDALGLGAHSTTDTAASAPAQMLLRLLRVHRPLGPGQQPQPVTSQQQQQEADAKGAGDAASTSSSSSSGGGLLSNSVNMGFVGAPVELGLTGLSDLVQQAAVRLEEGLGKAAAVDRVLGSSHAQVCDTPCVHLRLFVVECVPLPGGPGQDCSYDCFAASACIYTCIHSFKRNNDMMIVVNNINGDDDDDDGRYGWSTGLSVQSRH